MSTALFRTFGPKWSTLVTLPKSSVVSTCSALDKALASCQRTHYKTRNNKQTHFISALSRNFSSTSYALQRKYVLGIETSCDDTGAAVVDDQGLVIGEALNSQTAIHNETGGIIPNIAKELHAQNVEAVVSDALASAQMNIQDMDAIAVTVEPGLVMSLREGMKYAQCLSQQERKPVIPIHHMEAHALTARMMQHIEFPFMVLLASGGHCLLAIARNIDDFLLLGSSLDIAPGDAFDKTARELKLFKQPHLHGMSGGAAVEQMAKGGNPQAFPLVHVMSGRANCNFSFTGLMMSARKKILAEYERLAIPDSVILPNASDICAWFQYNVTYHIGRRLQRAFIYADMFELLGSNKTLVLSGGVASNSYIRANLKHVCHMYHCQLICPPAKLCTDNGIMIAWNGMEKLKSGKNFFVDPMDLDVKARSPLGQDISRDVGNSSIKLPKLTFKVMTS